MWPYMGTLSSLCPSKDDMVKKKKKNVNKEQVTLAKEIPGHIGDKEVDYLVSYVNGEQEKNLFKESRKKSNNTGNMGIGKKKGINNYSASNNESVSEDDNGTEETIDSGMDKSIPSCSSIATINSKFSPEVAQNSDGSLSTSLNTSKSQILEFSSESLKLNNSNILVTPTKVNKVIGQDQIRTMRDENSDDEQRYTASDSEMADQEIGFQMIKSKHIKAKKRRALGRKLDTTPRPFHSSASSASTTPSLSSNSHPSSTIARGYESEREYRADDYTRRKEHQSRRKLASSMPHSERNSAENSDDESSCSFPVTGRLPISPPINCATSTSTTSRASYADIAKMGPVFAMQTGCQVVNVKPSNSCNSLPPTGSHCSSNDSKKIFLKSGYKDEGPKFDENEESKDKLIKGTKRITSDAPSTPNGGRQVLDGLISPPVRGNFDLVSEKSARSWNTNIKFGMRKSHSVGGEAKCDDGLVNTSSTNSLPPVIMYDDSNVRDNIGSSFTFGFFEDVQTCKGLDPKASEAKEVPAKIIKSPPEASPESLPKVSDAHYLLDIDKNAFNYNQIINYFRTAWEKVLNDYKNCIDDISIKMEDGPNQIIRETIYYEAS